MASVLDSAEQALNAVPKSGNSLRMGAQENRRLPLCRRAAIRRVRRRKAGARPKSQRGAVRPAYEGSAKQAPTIRSKGVARRVRRRKGQRVPQVLCTASVRIGSNSSICHEAEEQCIVHAIGNQPALDLSPRGALRV